jgi:hypothetical protein
MCLLVTQSVSSPSLPEHWLSDFYDNNADGIGVMYAENNTLYVEKALPKTDAELYEFYAKHIDGKDCAFHLRMKTHGDIDMLNCHPYEILNKEEHGVDMWMMHNGVLSTGNKADVTKSDTWHYINDILRPMLAKNPNYAFTPSFEYLISGHIGNNRFVIMDNLGRRTVVNQSQGVYWGGRWMSNTYAWSAPTLSKTKAKDMLDTKLALSQVNAEPEPYTYPLPTAGSSYGVYPYHASQYSSYDCEWDDTKWVDDIVDTELDIDDALVELGLDGYEKAGNMSRRQAGEFVNKFGLDSFFEITYLLKDDYIDESWFVRVMSDFATARESFPWLEDKKGVAQ